jgi:hypothetical protein
VFVERKHVQTSTVVYTNVNAANAKFPMLNANTPIILVSLPLLPGRREDDSLLARLIFGKKKTGEQECNLLINGGAYTQHASKLAAPITTHPQPRCVLLRSDDVPWIDSH